MSGHYADTTLSGLERAPRYGIHMGMRYRSDGETEWHEAQTENVSRSGVLFRVAEELKVSALVEMRFMLPLETPGKESAEVLCQGWIVRSSPVPSDEKFHLMAAKILDYRFVRDIGAGAAAAAGQEH